MRSLAMRDGRGQTFVCFVLLSCITTSGSDKRRFPETALDATNTRHTTLPQPGEQAFRIRLKTHPQGAKQQTQTQATSQKRTKHMKGRQSQPNFPPSIVRTKNSLSTEQQREEWKKHRCECCLLFVFHLGTCWFRLLGFVCFSRVQKFSDSRQVLCRLVPSQRR